MNSCWTSNGACCSRQPNSGMPPIRMRVRLKICEFFLFRISTTSPFYLLPNFLQVGIHAVQNRVSVGHATLVPAIHWLPALLTLLFAPRVELRADGQCARFTGALCGLGFDSERHVPLPHQEHDGNRFRFRHHHMGIV